MSVDVRVAEAMKQIFEEIPKRLDITAIVTDAHQRLLNAVNDPEDPITSEAAKNTDFLRTKVIEVLREIATYTVEQFTRRTGQPFQWVDEPEFEVSEENSIMTFKLDEKGNVTF